MTRKEYMKEYSKRYYESHKERIKEKNADWARNNKEKRSAINARYKAIHKEELDDYERKNRHLQRGRNLRFFHDISLEDYNALFARQNGLCLGCYRHQSQFKLALAVDHNHTTGKLRGLLCGQCNTALGLTKDSPKTLRRLAEYLETH